MTDLPPLNRKALTALILSIVALLAFCAGLLPVPLTALICYPPGILLGLASLVLGLRSLREIRGNGERGQALAQVSVWAGGLMLLVMTCAVATGILLWPYVTEFVKQTWIQLTH